MAVGTGNLWLVAIFKSYSKDGERRSACFGNVCARVIAIAALLVLLAVAAIAASLVQLASLGGFLARVSSA